MLIEIDHALYTKIKRDDALNILKQAQIAPDKFTAHRDGTFTARYERDRQHDFQNLSYEARLESADHRVAIFKRPSDALDVGKYVTLRFAVVAIDAVGINASTLNGKNGHSATPAGSAAIVNRLNGISRDMQQLASYARSLTDQYHTHKHLTVTLEELQRQITLLNAELAQLNAP